MRLLLMLMCALLLCAAPAAAETTALSVRTQDGLVVLHGARDILIEVQKDLTAAMQPGAGNIDLLEYVYKKWTVEQVRPEAYAAAPGEEIPDGASDNATAVIIETTVAEAMKTGRIPSLGGRELYEAYMLVRMRGDTFMLLSEPPPGKLQLRHTVFVFSSAWGSGFCGIYVDGVDVLRAEGEDITDANGYKLVALNPEDLHLEIREFKTFDDPEAGLRMQEFLNAQPEGAVLLGSVRWGPGVYISGGAVDALHAYGSATEPDSQILSSHAMIGAKGLPSGQAIEAGAVNAGAQVVLFDSKLYVSEEQIRELRADEGARIIAMAGTKPDDKVFIVGREF